VSRHEQQSLLLLPPLAQGYDPDVVRTPPWQPDHQAADLASPHGDEVLVGLHPAGKQGFEEHLVLALPHAGLLTLERPPDHPRGAVGIEAAHTVEPDVPHDPRAGTQLTADRDAGRVVVGCAGEALRVLGVFARPSPPDTTETKNAHAHGSGASLQAFILVLLGDELLLQDVDLMDQVGIRSCRGVR